MEALSWCPAKPEDFPKIAEFYRYVIANTETMPVFGRWIYGLHPDDEGIREYLNSGTMFTLEKDGTIAAAFAVTLSQGEDYHDTPWQIPLADDEAAVVHLLCVNPAMQRQGIAKAAMAMILDYARQQGKLALRLDALACNTPAHKLYEGLGFRKMGTAHWYACNVGWTDFFLYEYLL